MALTTFKVIPLKPFPSMIPPIYFPGRIPPKAKMDDYMIPPNKPKTTRIEISAANAWPEVEASYVTTGRTIINTAIAKHVPEILISNENFYP
jgi:hypothetical protein